jgi:hypothetical protein
VVASINAAANVVAFRVRRGEAASIDDEAGESILTSPHDSRTFNERKIRGLIEVTVQNLRRQALARAHPREEPHAGERG